VVMVGLSFAWSGVLGIGVGGVAGWSLATWANPCPPQHNLERHKHQPPNAQGFSRRRDATSETDLCRRLGLRTPAEAQWTRPVVLRGFLGPDEVAAVLDALRVAQERRLVGQIERDAQGRLVAQGVWRTTYLHSGGLFSAWLPGLAAKCRQAIMDADHGAGWGATFCRDCADLNFRTCEIHEYGARGQLEECGHYDAGSLVTLDIMLADPAKDFGGGNLLFPRVDGSVESVHLRKGDAAVFLSHKYHNVEPVTHGRRRVLVLELWDGPVRHCAHRCIQSGHCGYSLGKAHLASTAQQLALLG